MMTNLYAVTSEAIFKIEGLYDLENEVPDEVILDTIEAVEGEVKQRQLSFAAYILNLENEVESAKGYIDRMTYRKEMLKKRVERYRECLKASLIKMGEEKVKGIEFDIKIQKNPPKAVEVSPELTPEKYVYYTEPEKKFMRDQIKFDIQAGVQVPGWRVEHSDRLKIDNGKKG